MQRPIRLVVALLVAASVSLVPALAFGAGGGDTGSSSPAGSDTATPPGDSAPVGDGTETAGEPTEPRDAAVETTDVEQGVAPDAAPVTAPAPAVASEAPRDVAPEVVAKVDDRPRDRVRLACEPANRDTGFGIGCRWSEASSSPAAGYRLWRAVDVPNPRDHRRIVARGGLDFVSHFDTDVSGGHVYHYAVEIVDARGRTLGWSDTVRVALVRDEQLRLACEAVDGDRGTGLLCEWSESRHPAFAGYRLIRGDGHGRVTVFETREVSTTRFLDEQVRRGVRYTYGIQVIDAHGRVIGTGGPSTAGLRPMPNDRPVPGR